MAEALSISSLFVMPRSPTKEGLRAVDDVRPHPSSVDGSDHCRSLSSWAETDLCKMSLGEAWAAKIQGCFVISLKQLMSFEVSPSCSRKALCLLGSVFRCLFECVQSSSLTLSSQQYLWWAALDVSFWGPLLPSLCHMSKGTFCFRGPSRHILCIQCWPIPSKQRTISLQSKLCIAPPWSLLWDIAISTSMTISLCVAVHTFLRCMTVPSNETSARGLRGEYRACSSKESNSSGWSYAKLHQWLSPPTVGSIPSLLWCWQFLACLRTSHWQRLCRASTLVPLCLFLYYRAFYLGLYLKGQKSREIRDF